MTRGGMYILAMGLGVEGGLPFDDFGKGACFGRIESHQFDVLEIKPPTYVDQRGCRSRSELANERQGGDRLKCFFCLWIAIINNFHLSRKSAG